MHRDTERDFFALMNPEIVLSSVSTDLVPSKPMNYHKLLFKQTVIAASLLLLLAFVAHAQDQPLKLNYRLAMSQPSSHLFEVTIEGEAPPSWTAESLDFPMPKWSPARYAVLAFMNKRGECRCGTRTV